LSINSKEIISEALFELMEGKSYESITISEICNNTSLVRKTFYNNFSSKDAVILYEIRKLAAEFNKNIVSVGETSPRESAYLFFAFAKGHRKIMNILLDNNLFHVFSAEFESFLPDSNTIISESNIMNLDPNTTSYISAFHSAGMVRMLTIWLENDCSTSVSNISDIYDYISKKGVLNSPC